MNLYDNLTECDKSIINKIINEIKNEMKNNNYTLKQNEVSYRIGSGVPLSKYYMYINGEEIKNDQ